MHHGFQTEKSKPVQKLGLQIFLLFLILCLPGNQAGAQIISSYVFSVNPDLPVRHRMLLSATSSENQDMSCSLIVKAYYGLEDGNERYSFLIKNVKMNVLRSEDKTPDHSFGEDDLINLGIPGARYSGGEVKDARCIPATDPAPPRLPPCAKDGDLTQAACGASFQKLPVSFSQPSTSPLNRSLRSLSYGNNMLLAATENGLFISHDKGKSFAKLYAGLVNDIKVHGSSIYAATHAGVYISKDKGFTHTIRTNVHGLGENHVSRIFVDGNTLYASTSAGLSISTDGGESFTNKHSVDKVGAVYAKGDRIYVSAAGGLWMSSNGGKTFMASPDPRFHGSTIWIQDIVGEGERLFILTSNRLAVSNDDGLSFAFVNNSMGWTWVNDIELDGSNLYITSDRGLAISRDGGQPVALGDMTSGYALQVAAAGSTVFTSTERLGFSVSEDGGVSFPNKIHIPDSFDVRAVALAGNRILVATSSGLAVSENQGASFSSYSTDHGIANNSLNALFIEGSTIYAATEGGLSISEDSGVSFKNFTKENGLPTNSIKAVFARNGIIYVGTEGGLSLSRDAGQSFTFTNFLPKDWVVPAVTSIVADEHSIYAATPLGLAISRDEGTTFTFKNKASGLPSDQVRKVFMDNGKIYIICGDILMVSKDDGRTFQTVLKRAVDAYAKGSRIFVVTDLSFSASFDEGKTFTATSFKKLGAVSAFGDLIIAASSDEVYSIIPKESM